jgi:glycosyltransferase involved in cell wall biosynthesis
LTDTGSTRSEGGKRADGTANEACPKVSIITATYNAAPTFERCLESVLSQSRTDWEYIVIDGGSTDGTLELLHRHRDDIDYWFSEPDDGVYDALNKGIALARGEWIYFLGADDYLIDPDVLQRIFAEELRGLMIYGNVYFTFYGNVYSGEFSRCKLVTRNICHQAIFYNKRLFEMFGCFDQRYRVLADWIFNLHCFFDDRVKPRYMDTVIAFYDGRGFSERNTDQKFRDEYFAIIKNNYGRMYYYYLRFRILTDKHVRASFRF